MKFLFFFISIFKSFFIETNFFRYGLAPTLVVEGGLERPFNYVTPHLVTILLELLKNAMEATMIKHQHSDKIPPVTILISQFQNKVVMKIHDEGIGIAPDDMPKVDFFRHFFSSRLTFIMNILLISLIDLELFL